MGKMPPGHAGTAEATGWSSDGRSKDVQIGGREIPEVRYRKRLAGREPGPGT